MSFTQLKQAHTYGRIPPNLFNMRVGNESRVRALYISLGQEVADCLAEGYTLHDHCYIYDGCYVMGLDLEWVAETVVDYGIAEQIKPVIQDVIRGRHQRQLPHEGTKTVVIAKSGADNYGHVLTDILPKLVNLGRAGLSPIRLLLPTAMQRYAGLVAGILGYTGVVAEFEFHAPATLVEAREVYVFSPVGQHNSRKSTTFLELADMLCALHGITMEHTRRIYVRRGPSDHRSIQQAAAVEAAFAVYGFESVFPGDLSVEDQIRLFASASHVAGPMGAGMANMGWAPPGCDVFMLDPGMADTYFWDFSCLLQQRFNWLFAGPVLGYSDALSRADYAVDADLLGATLRLVYG